MSQIESEYTLKEVVANKDWDDFIDASSNGTIFLKSYYLQAISAKYRLFFCYKKEELRAGVGVIESEDGKNIVLNDFVIYDGILYNQPTNKQNHAQQFSEQFKIQSFIAEELTKRYCNIELSLHPSIVDIRAFLWVNYGENAPQYKPNIRYTSYIAITDFQNAKKVEDIALYAKASTSRRQQIRYALKKNYKTLVCNDVQPFLDFYVKTMKRQDITVDEVKLISMKNLINALIEKQVAKIYASYDETNELGSMAFIGWDTKRAYYIFGASDPDKRDGHSGTAVLWDAFYDLSAMGISEVDLEGVNSPRRGWFKLSFGGDLLPYYELCYESLKS